MMGRSFLLGTLAVVGLTVGTTSVAEAHDPYCHPHRASRGYGVAVGIGYAPRYVAPPPFVYGPPLYGPPVYVAPPPYAVPYGHPYGYGYAPYPAAGVGVNTRSFGLWIGR
jgi:hypothetical protein